MKLIVIAKISYQDREHFEVIRKFLEHAQPFIDAKSIILKSFKLLQNH